jgi:hypothetical protein
MGDAGWEGLRLPVIRYPSALLQDDDAFLDILQLYRLANLP